MPNRNELFNQLDSSVGIITNRCRRFPPLEFTVQANEIDRALLRLNRAIEAKMNDELLDTICHEKIGGLSKKQLTYLKLETFDEMLDVSILTWENESIFSYFRSGYYTPQKSLKMVLTEYGYLEEVESHLESFGYEYHMTAETLCEMVKNNDVYGVKSGYFGTYQAEKLIEMNWGDLLSASAIYNGVYNAIMLAVIYRRAEIVTYFVDTLKVDLCVLGGRNHDISILDCAKTVWWGEVPVDLRLVTYLEKRLLARTRSSSTESVPSTLFARSRSQSVESADSDVNDVIIRPSSPYDIPFP